MSQAFRLSLELSRGAGLLKGNCRYLGSFEPFDEATLKALYANDGRYVSQVAQSTYENVRDGFIVIEDAIVTVQTAASSQFGK